MPFWFALVGNVSLRAGRAWPGGVDPVFCPPVIVGDGGVFAMSVVLWMPAVLLGQEGGVRALSKTDNPERSKAKADP